MFTSACITLSAGHCFSRACVSVWTYKLDYSVGMRPTKFGYPEDWPADEKAAMTKKLREKFVAEELPKFMGYFAAFINESGGAFLCGSKPTLADLTALPQITYFSKGIADFVDPACLDGYPVIKAWIDRMMAFPAIAKYYSDTEAKA